MPVPRAMLLFQVDYMAWANQEILRACSALSPEELDCDVGISHRGILGTLRHMFVAEHDWLVRLRHSMTRPDIEPGQELFYASPTPGPGLFELRELWNQVWPAWRVFVETIEEAEFDRHFAAMGARIPRWKLIQHVVNHATLHRGQVMGMLRQRGLQPPRTDLFEYYRAHDGARLREW
jgi:uncharacterized damage-inducible protein DinB